MLYAFIDKPYANYKKILRKSPKKKFYDIVKNTS